MSGSITFVALGNSNNLFWMILHGIADRGYNCILFMTDKKKRRDQPLFSHPNLKVKIVSHFSGSGEPLLDPDSLKLIAQADLLLVSGEYFISLPGLRSFLKKKCVIIGVPIGYDIEELCINARICGNYIQHNTSRKISRALALCHFIFQNDNSPAPIKAELKKQGVWDRRLNISRGINIIRYSMANKILDQRSHAIHKSLQKNILRLDKADICSSIFLATRITSCQTSSTNNKGSHKLYETFIMCAKKYSTEDIKLILINRDQASNRFISELQEATRHLGLEIYPVKELRYSDFLYILSRCMIAIDSFDVKGNLRPHMTTADALSVGAPISTSWGHETPARLISDKHLGIFDSRVLFDTNKLISLVPLDPNKRKDCIQKRLIESHYACTESAEADTLISLAEGNIVPTDFMGQSVSLNALE